MEALAFRDTPEGRTAAEKVATKARKALAEAHAEGGDLAPPDRTGALIDRLRARLKKESSPDAS